MWCDVVGVVWCGVVWCGVVWCGRCGVVGRSGGATCGDSEVSKDFERTFLAALRSRMSSNSRW